MLVTFTTKAYADITMFGDVAVTLLKMMGHSATVPGAIVAEDVPTALRKLTAAINVETDPEPLEDEEGQPVISTAHRAWPLIELLTAAEKEGSDVMWK